MSKDENVDENAEDKPRVRRIVRSAATTPRLPGQPEDGQAPGGEAAAGGESGAGATGQGGGAAPASGAGPRGERRIDVRAPRPPGGAARPPRRPERPRGPKPPWTRRADQEPGAPLSRSEEAKRRLERAMGGGGPGAGRGDARPGPRERRPEASRPEGARPPRERREGRDTRQEPGAGPRERPRAEARPAAPAPRPAAPASVPMPPPPPAPVPLFVPRPKAAQKVAKAEKPVMTAKEALRAKVSRATQQAPRPKAERRDEARPDGEAPEFDAAALEAGWEGAEAAVLAAGERGEALVEAWFARSNAAAVAAVAESDKVPGPARKAARRAQNVLRARGVATPAKPKIARLNDAALSSFEAFEATLLPPDGLGTTAVSIAARDGSGRYRIAEVIVRDRLGVLQAGGAWLSYSQIKESRARALDSLGVAPVAVPLEWARHRVAKARAQNAISKQILPLGLEACRELVEPAPREEPPHPVADLEAGLTGEEAKQLAERSGELHAEPEFRSWMPERAALDEIVRNVSAALAGDAGEGGEKVAEALRQEMAAAADRYFTAEIRGLVAERMRDAAISVRARRGDEKAREVLAVARCVADAELAAQPRELPFLFKFFEKAFEPNV